RALGLVARSQAGASGLKALSPPRPRRLSHKGLHTFILCPMRWFLESLPDMADSSADPEPLAEGTLTHSLIGDMFRALAGADGRLAPGALQSAPSLLKQLYGKAVAGTIRSFGPALQPSLEATEPRIVDRLIRLVKAEGEFEAAGWEIGKFEANLAWDREDLGLVLEGRADRLAKGAGGRFALVDYKKNGTPSASQVRIGSDGTIGDFQLALYALMLSASGLEPGVALYWSVESGKPLYVFGGDAEKPDWQSFMPERDAVESLIRSTVAAMDEGRILQARPDESTCSSCGLKPICRAHFASEAR
ncbi:MAG TPA: PD-(D/E)XK nuclease family protein, partial [Rectinemataceae bacterium]